MSVEDSPIPHTEARIVPGAPALASVAGRVLVRPRLWIPLLRAAWRFRRRNWYRRAPFLPVPPAEYLAWRLHTAYGDEPGVGPEPEELDRYLRWTERMRDMRRSPRIRKEQAS